MPKKSRSKKKADQKPGQETRKVERLVLYVIGKSSIPLSTYDIEKKVLKEMPPGPKEQKYTYVILKRLVPHKQVPYMRLFSINDFFDCENSIRVILNDDERDRLNKRVIRNIFKSYGHLLGEKEDDWECSIPEREKEGFVISIKHRKEQHTLLRFVIRKKEDSKQLSTSLFYNNNEIPLCEVWSEGTTKIYSAEHFPYLHFKHYLDEVPKYLPDAGFNNNPIPGFEAHQIGLKDYPREDSQFVLNLRGLLHYLLLNKQTNEIEYQQMNEVIETIAEVDKYHELEDEFKAMDPVRHGFTIGDKFFLENKISPYKIKERFPFLSYYNEYKECLPVNFAVDTLYEIAIHLQDKLEKMNIFDLKYEITGKFLEKIEGVIWDSPDGFSKPYILSMNPAFKTIRNAYRNYQHEIRKYLKVRKEKEIKIIEKRERYIHEEFEILEFKQKVIEHIENEYRDFFPINEIFLSNNDGRIHSGLTGTQINILNSICKSNESKYYFGGQHLFKRSFFVEIEELLVPEMDYEIVKKILMEKGIYEEGVLTEILGLTKYSVDFDKKMQIYRIVKKRIPKL